MNLRRTAIASSDYWEFQPGEHVMTIDGFPGVIELVEDGPMAGAENYVIKLDNDLGGGNYSASMLTRMPTSRSAAGIHLATDDYPELGTVIDDRPDPGKMTFTAALSQERQAADAEDHDEPGGDDQPHSCSYCGGTEFKDLTDNGRVRQATCATCNGTMSAHPGAQWTPELIGDPSNHPAMTVDPRSGASGAAGQAGINDFIDFDSRVSTTAALAAEHGISHVYRGVHGPSAASAAEANRAGEMGSGMYGRGFYTTSSPDLATSYAQAHSGDRTGVFMHGQIHPDAHVTPLDDVPKHVSHGAETDWARENGHDVLTDGVHTHIVANPHVITWDPRNYDVGEAYKKFNKWGEDYGNGPEDLHHTAAAGDDENKTIPTKRVGFAGYVEAEKTNFPNHGDNPDWEDEQAVGAHAGVHEFRGYSGRENDFAHWHDKGEIGPVPLRGSKIYATQPRVTQRGIDTYLDNPEHKSGSGRPNYPANERPIFVKDGGDYYTLDGHHRTAAAMLRGDDHVEGHIYDADKHGFPTPEWSPISKHLPRSLSKYATQGCAFASDDEDEALRHELAFHDDGFCSARGHQKTAAVDGPDWCTWRRTARCTFPGDITTDGHVLGIPQDRGPCPWETRWQQQVCPISEPGPGAAMERKGSATSKQVVEPSAMLRTAARDRDLGFHITASWADVQRKAKRIRAEGGVTIVIASNDGIGGTVQGDHGTYEALLVYRPGTKKVADWTCGCKWAAYAFDRSPGFQRFEGRKCSHALALQFEAQSQGMFGKEVHPSEPTSRERTIVRYDPDADEHIFARPYEGSLISSLVARLRADDADPAEAVGSLVRAGVAHRTAVLLWKQGYAEERTSALIPVKKTGYKGYVDAYDGHHDAMDEADRDLDPDSSEAESDPDARPVGHHAAVVNMALRSMDSGLWKNHAQVEDIDHGQHDIYATQPYVTPQHLNRYIHNPDDSTQDAKNNPGHDLPANQHPLVVRHENNLFAIEGHHRIAANMATGRHTKALVYDADKHGFPEPSEMDYPVEHPGLVKNASKGADCDFEISGAHEAAEHALRHHDDGICTLTERQRGRKHTKLSAHEHHREGSARYASGTAAAIEVTAADQAPTGAIGLDFRRFGGVVMPLATGDLPSVHGGGGLSGQNIRAEGARTQVVQPHAQAVQAGFAAGTVRVPVVAAMIDDELGWDLPSGHQPHEAVSVEVFPLEDDAPVAVPSPGSDPHVAAFFLGKNDLAKGSGGKDLAQPSVAGLCLKAHDTGRILMLQRGLDDENDPAAGTWEMPGGHIEAEDPTSLHAALREWQEEVGQPFPAHGAVKHVWSSPNGVYQGHVVVIPSEKDLSMKDGRVIPNPDDPKGDGHEQAAWWHPDDAKKIPNLREEVKAHTPWKEIAKASLDSSKEASAWDPISNTNPQPGRGTNEPAHSNTTNPASTGWAASEDPDNWNNLDANPQPLTPTLGFDAVLHAHPEPALPVTYGDEDATMRPAEFTQDDLDPIPDNPPRSADLVPDSDANIHLLNGGSPLPNTYHASAEGDRVAEIVATFQKSAAGQQLAAETSGDDDEIAAAARAHLAKEGAKQFDFAEQQELITEGNDGRRARNLGALKIQGTHYELLDAALRGEAIEATDLFI